MAEWDMIGKWAFIIGIVVAILAAFVPNVVSTSTLVLLLFVLGLLVGFLNVAKKDSHTFLLGVITLIVIGAATLSALDVLGVLGNYLGSILGNFVAFVVGAGLVVSIKAVFETSR